VIVTVALPKGGVGKTVTFKELAAAAAGQGRRVLVIDMDPTAVLTRQLGLDADDPDSLYPADGALWHAGDVLMRRIDIAQATIAHPEGFDLLAGHSSLRGVEMTLVAETARELRLRQALKPIADSYDWILIDTPPTVGVLWVNAIVVADVIVAPIAAQDEGGIRATQALLDDVENAQLLRADDSAPTIYPILTRWRARNTMCRLAESYVTALGLEVAAEIPDRVAVTQAAARKRTLQLTDPDSPAAVAYHHLMTKIEKERT
jgi:chromosome partitioning protein